MNWDHKLAGEDDPEIAQALRNFKASVDAWSEAEMSRPRSVKAVRRSWRLAASWALGCVVAAGTLAGAVYERQHQHEQARIAAAKAAAQKAAQEQQSVAQDLATQTDQDLLANVDKDISRAVPAAMEPLAQLMDEKQTDDNGAQ
jgi:1-aminocyclopropane-1-carboxylate deaminase/D-cysteine desulfhydrase-like pyridoxal-dependent ACC family enzyme